MNDQISVPNRVTIQVPAAAHDIYRSLKTAAPEMPDGQIMAALIAQGCGDSTLIDKIVAEPLALTDLARRIDALAQQEQRPRRDLLTLTGIALACTLAVIAPFAARRDLPAPVPPEVYGRLHALETKPAPDMTPILTEIQALRNEQSAAWKTLSSDQDTRIKVIENGLMVIMDRLDQSHPQNLAASRN